MALWLSGSISCSNTCQKTETGYNYVKFRRTNPASKQLTVMGRFLSSKAEGCQIITQSSYAGIRTLKERKKRKSLPLLFPLLKIVKAGQKVSKNILVILGCFFCQLRWWPFYLYNIISQHLTPVWGILHADNTILSFSVPEVPNSNPRTGHTLNEARNF